MVTDQPRFEQLMKDFGIEPTKEDVEGGKVTFVLEAQHTSRVEGYFGFQACFTFDAHGNFIQAGVWE